MSNSANSYLEAHARLIETLRQYQEDIKRFYEQRAEIDRALKLREEIVNELSAVVKKSAIVSDAPEIKTLTQPANPAATEKRTTASRGFVGHLEKKINADPGHDHSYYVDAIMKQLQLPKYDRKHISNNLWWLKTKSGRVEVRGEKLYPVAASGQAALAV